METRQLAVNGADGEQRRAAGDELYLTIVGTIIAFGSYIWLLRRGAPTLVATYTFVNPIIAVLLGFAFLGES